MKNNSTALEASFLVEYFDVVCQMKTEIFTFEVLKKTRAVTSKSFILYLYMTILMWHFRCSSRQSFFKSRKANFSNEYGNTKGTSFKMNIVAVVTIFSIIPAFSHYTFEMVGEPLKWNELKIFTVVCSSCQQHCNCRNLTLSKWHTCSSFFSPHPTNQILCIWSCHCRCRRRSCGSLCLPAKVRSKSSWCWGLALWRAHRWSFVCCCDLHNHDNEMLKIKRKWNSKNNYNWWMERELDHQHENPVLSSLATPELLWIWMGLAAIRLLTILLTSIIYTPVIPSRCRPGHSKGIHGRKDTFCTT